jgi:hypothetical protein
MGAAPKRWDCLRSEPLSKSEAGKKNQWTAASTKLAGRPSRHRQAHRSTATAAMPALPKMDLRKHAT